METDRVIPRLRRVVMLLLAAVAAVLAASATGAAAGKPSAPAAAPPTVKADRDGDKLFDDLEARLAAAEATEQIAVLVRLTTPATAARVEDTVRLAGGFVTGRRFSIVDAFAAEVNKGQAEALTHVPWVAHVELNSVVRASNDGARAAFGVTKAQADVPSLDGDADGNATAFTKDDLVAAVIDTGIDAKHLDLDEGKVIAFKDFVNGRTDAYDDSGHGTHVAATIAG